MDAGVTDLYGKIIGIGIIVVLVIVLGIGILIGKII